MRAPGTPDCPAHSTACETALQVHLDIPIFLSNAAAAFGLNMSVFMLIGKTSALTMNVAGVIKDWLLIGLSVLIFKAQVGAESHATSLGSHRTLHVHSCPSCICIEMTTYFTLSRQQGVEVDMIGHLKTN